jgi:phenylpropionate dioxygenase-like ring-hydroxylating dioxygenase large terminal subunit
MGAGLIETTLFHPVALVGDVGARPLAARLMGHDLVLWRAAGGALHGAADRCPHRGAALSMGRVVGDTLECGYHGWRFDGRGQCVAVPALPDFTPPPEHRACMYSVRVAYGLVWVALRADVPEDAPGLLPAFAAEDDRRLRKVNCGPYDVATSGPRIIENFLDMAHFGFVHEGWLGSRDRVAMAPHPVTATPTGFIATECMAWQPQSSLHATSGAMVEYTYEVNAPYTCVLTKIPEAESVALAGFRESIAMFVCPLSPEQSRVWIRLAMNDFESSDQRLQDFQDTIFRQDQPVLESQRPRTLPISDEAPVKELHSAADRSSAAYRRYLRASGVNYGIC